MSVLDEDEDEDIQNPLFYLTIFCHSHLAFGRSGSSTVGLSIHHQINRVGIACIPLHTVPLPTHNIKQAVNCRFFL